MNPKRHASTSEKTSDRFCRNLARRGRLSVFEIPAVRGKENRLPYCCRWRRPATDPYWTFAANWRCCKTLLPHAVLFLSPR
jgi:hypothetical protein